MTEDTKDKSTRSWRRFVFLAQWRLSEMLALSIICVLGFLILVVHLSTWGVQAHKEAKFLSLTDYVVEASTVRSDPDHPQSRFRPEVTICYTVNGETFTTTTYDRLTLTDDKGFSYDYETARNAIIPYYQGYCGKCWVRLDDPTKAVLVKRTSVWGWVFLIIPTLLILSGGSLLCSRIYERHFSKEARASAKRQSTRYPTIPRIPAEESSPGVELSRRLIPDARSTFAFASGLVGTLVWNLVSWTIFIIILSGVKTPGNAVSACVFGAIFCGLGLVFGRRLRTRYQIERVAGATELEISTLPVIPGRKANFCLFLRGRIHAKRLEVFVKCEEIARYVQGTNSIVHRHETYRATLLTKYGIEIPPHESQQERFTATLPIGSVPSFCSEHNEIVWKVVLLMEFEDGDTFTRDFEIVVYPFLPKDN